MFAMTFIISDVVSSVKGCNVDWFSWLVFTGMCRWQTFIQASIPLCINSARPKLRSRKKSVLFKACARNDSYCESAPSDLLNAEKFLNVVIAFFFFEPLHARYFLGEHLHQISLLSVVQSLVHEEVCLLRPALR